LSPLGNLSGEAKIRSNCDRTANPRYALSAQTTGKRTPHAVSVTPASLTQPPCAAL